MSVVSIKNTFENEKFKWKPIVKKKLGDEIFVNLSKDLLYYNTLISKDFDIPNTYDYWGYWTMKKQARLDFPTGRLAWVLEIIKIFNILGIPVTCHDRILWNIKVKELGPTDKYY